MLQESDIREALRACYGTAGPAGQSLNIVDLGAVLSISLREDRDAPGAGIAGVPERYALTLQLIQTSSEDDARARLHAQIMNVLYGLPQVSKASVHFSSEAVWTEARITPEGRRILKLDSQPFAILNNRSR